MISKQEITCKCGCGRKRLVRTADIKRGGGKYFDKSCKARHQEQKTGQYKQYHMQNIAKEYNDFFYQAHLFSNEE